MKTRLCRAAVCLMIALCLTPLFGIGASAHRGDARYTNPQTGYDVLILDEDDLLSEEEEAALVQVMTPITDYGDIIFWSTDEYTPDEIDQAKSKRYELYGNESSGIFSINMNIRMVTFQSDGAIYSMVSRSYARSITDNVSGYASSGDYYMCAAQAYAQVYEVLQGNRIAEPMKYISYAVISLMLAFVIVAGVVFGRRFNPIIKHNNETARPLGSGYLLTGAPQIRCTNTEMRGWVKALLITLRILLAAAGSGGSSSGGRSRSGGGGSSGGGGGGGSSRF